MSMGILEVGSTHWFEYLQVNLKEGGQSYKCIPVDIIIPGERMYRGKES